MIGTGRNRMNRKVQLLYQKSLICPLWYFQKKIKTNKIGVKFFFELVFVKRGTLFAKD